MNDHHQDGVVGADRLGEGAGIHPGIVLQGTHEEIGDGGDGSEEPRQTQVPESVLEAVEPVVLQAVADIAVAVDGDGGDVEDGADHTQTHDEAADLTVHVAHSPFVMEDGQKNQGIWVHCYCQVCYGQADHKDVSCRKRKGKISSLLWIFKCLVGDQEEVCENQRIPMDLYSYKRQIKVFSPSNLICIWFYSVKTIK